MTSKKCPGCVVHLLVLAALLQGRLLQGRLCVAADATVYEINGRSAREIALQRSAPDPLKRLGVDESSPLGVGGSAFSFQHVHDSGITWARMGGAEVRPDQAGERLKTEGDDFRIMGAYGRIRGIIDWKGKTRVYVKPAREDAIYAFDSEDLVAWKRSKKPDFPTEMALIQVGGRVYGYTEEGTATYLWNKFNPDKGCRNRLWKMYEWKLDGTLAPSHTEAGWIQLGRVRGYRSQNKGGWGDDRVEHPDIEDFPRVKKAFEGTPYDAEAWLQDRRGLSLHTSRDGKHWTSRILLDPKDVNLPGFRGWRNRDSEGIADLYSAVMIDSRRAFVKVYWKQKDRLIDRRDYNPDIEIRRRFRFTGETTFVPAVLHGGKLKITSTISVIPKKLHERAVTKKQVPWATKPGVREVGQITPHNRVIIRDGYAHIFYYYRDDVHYEGGWEGKEESVNVYRMKKEDFDRLFQ